MDCATAVDSFIAILVAAGGNVIEVSEWPVHNGVAFTWNRYSGLFDDGAAEAADASILCLVVATWRAAVQFPVGDAPVCRNDSVAAGECGGYR